MSPGSIYPLRALNQDEQFSAAIAVIRHYPRATLGLPFLSGLISLTVSLVVLLIAPSPAYLRLLTDPVAFEDPELAAAVFSDASLLLVMTVSTALSGLLGFTALGLLAVPSLRAAFGLPTTLWLTLRLRARRIGWLLLYLVLLSVVLMLLFGILVIAAAIIAGMTLFLGLIVILPGLYLLLCVITAAVMFGPVAIVVEGHNAFSAVARSINLNRGLWWRHIGLLALFYLVVGAAMMVASLPVGLLVNFGGELAWTSGEQAQEWWALLLVAGSQLFDIVLNTVLIAVGGTLVSVIYLNTRFRREALDVVLSDAAEAYDEGRAELTDAGSALDPMTMLPGSPEHLYAHHQLRAHQQRRVSG